ncbi:DUF3306 domain-containing protein [Aquibaculum arenosum]|uniref:DUF3306 domain-containing protein n=1 Tax=Aquibaculum arenosum TaxID=3032591 RepID=A0ABT5YQS0_9PROT|nr:DUF3306 domain-containing protein [Fodinicurvata sp. CAU 1616]MDF2096549.1 DUF3306 domain-containing protein [Fodinicurvata sp. CAU 1616]
MAHSDDEGFLSRWARRKAQREKDAERRDAVSAAEQAEPTPESAADSLSDAGEGESTLGEETVSAEDLPDPETLGRDDDWTPYLKRNVPSELRVKALRRLWRLDPVYANLDGLVDYAEDYNGPAFTGKPVKTLFQVGRGMVLPEKQEAAEKAAEEDATDATAVPAQELPDSIEAAPVADEEQQNAEALVDSDDPLAVPRVSGDAVEGAPASVDSPAVQGETAENHQKRPRRALARRWGGQ